MSGHQVAVDLPLPEPPLSWSWRILGEALLLLLEAMNSTVRTMSNYDDFVPPRASGQAFTNTDVHAVRVAAFNASVHALDQQATALDGLMTRSTNLLAALTAGTAFFSAPPFRSTCTRVA